MSNAQKDCFAPVCSSPLQLCSSSIESPETKALLQCSSCSTPFRGGTGELEQIVSLELEQSSTNRGQAEPKAAPHRADPMSRHPKKKVLSSFHAARGAQTATYLSAQ